MADVLVFAGLGLSVFALVSEIISVSLEYWIYVERAGVKQYAGLWKSCGEIAGNKICSSDGATDELRAVQAMVILGLLCTIGAPICAMLKQFDVKAHQHTAALHQKPPTDELRAVQAMVILGLLCTIAALICAVLKQFVMKEQKLLLYATTGLLAAAGLLLMIGFSVYVGELYDPRKSVYDLHAGFAFCVIAWLASWAAAAMFGLVVMKQGK